MRAVLRHGWLLAAVPVWLAARTVAYALAPASPLQRELEGRTGGGAPLVVSGAALLLVVGGAAALLWIASLGVRERAALAGEAAAPVAWRHVVLRTVAILVLAVTLFAGAELWLHVREGLGFHGWHCLFGPVHRDVLPFLGAFSVAAGLLVAAAERLVAWARRVVRALRARRPRPAREVRPRLSGTAFLDLLLPRRVGARAPPRVA